MLSYFPTPYPHEWMYSVYCRYHLRSGRRQNQTTIQELFGNRLTAAIGSIFPNNTIAQVVGQLPSTQFNVRLLILNHTLFLYYTRCYTIAQKEKMLAELCMGATAVITSIRRFGQLPAPRYCPACAEEDRRTYGEAFWRIEHQIPSMEICPTHGLMLLSVKGVDAAKVKYSFCPLDAEVLAPPEIPPAPFSWQMQFSKILYDYATFSLDCAATPGYSNLAIALGNMGYEVVQGYSPHAILDAKRLYHDLVGHYGLEVVGKVFGDERSICLLNRIGKWECLTPERYALLQCFAQLDTATVFSQERLPNLLEEQLRAMANSGVLYGKRQLCEALGITPSQLGILSKKYDISPFWTQNSTSSPGLHKISIVFSDAEHDQFKQALAQSGFRYPRHFAHHCVMEYLHTHFNQSKED